MRSQKLCLHQAMLVILVAFLTGSCAHPRRLLDLVTVTPTTTFIKTATRTPIESPTRTPTPNLELDGTTLDWPGQQGNPAHTGAVDMELPIAFEPKWVSPDFLGPDFGQWRVVADEEMVVVTDSAALLYLGINDLMLTWDSPTSSIIQAYNLSDGEFLWSYDTGGVLIGMPQIYQGMVYAVTRQPATTGENAFASIIHCLLAERGTFEWQQVLPLTHAGALTVQDGVLVLLAGTFELKDGDRAVPWLVETPVQALGFNAVTGDPLWSAPLLEKFQFSLEPPAMADGRVFVADGYLYALDLQTGQQLWKLDDQGERDVPYMGFTGDLVVADGKLFASAWHQNADLNSYHKTTYALNPVLGDILWEYTIPDIEHQETRERMSYHMGRLFNWGTWEEQGSQRFGLIALNAQDGMEEWHTEISEDSAPPAIGSNGRVLVSNYLDNLLLEERTGLILWSGHSNRESDPGVSQAHPWTSSFTYGISFPNPPKEQWLPNEWVPDVSGESLLLAGYASWSSTPALSGDFVIGVTNHSISHGAAFDGGRLVAYGPDTTPPDARILETGLVRRNLELTKIFGTAYDYNLKEWTLKLGEGNPPTTWEVLNHSTLTEQEMLADLGWPSHPRRVGDGNWTLRLEVTDITGLTSSDEWTFTNDYTGPSIAITSPADGKLINAGTFTLTGTASDTNGVTQVRVSSDGGRTFTLANGTTEWTLPITVTTAMEGRSVTYYAEATDTFGNVGSSNSVTFTFPRFQIALQAGGRRLVSTHSMFVDPELDMDGDGINQRWENAAMQLTLPIVELDEEEEWLYQFPESASKYPMVYFVRVTGYTPTQYQAPPTIPPTDNTRPTYILFYIVFGWSKDWGATGLGASDVLEAHRGDSENIVMAWRVTSDTTAELEWVRTSAHKDVNRHHGLWNAWRSSCTLANIALTFNSVHETEMMCSDLEFETNGRLVLYPAEDKHALYPDSGLCNNDVELIFNGDGENCGWDPLIDPITGDPFTGQWTDWDFRRDDHYLGGGRWLFEFYNVGEPDPCREHTLVDFLDQRESWQGLTDAQEQALDGLFPNEAVWSGNINTRAVWKNPPPTCTLATKDDGNYVERGREFCGGLEDTALEPEKCSTKLGTTLGMAEDWTDAGPPDLIDYALGARYQVTIKTGDREHAGTDALISLGLYIDGSLIKKVPVLSGDVTGTFLAPHNNVGSFERGDTDTIYLYDRDGEVTGISLAQDETGNSPNWFVEQIVVRDLVTGQVWADWPQIWLATDKAPNKTSAYVDLLPYQPGSVSHIEYQLIVATGNAEGAGTDADVSVTLNGAGGISSVPQILNAGAEDFERDSLGYYSIWAPDVGNLATLRVSISTGEGNARWYCREITLRNTMTGKMWVFPIESWLGGSSPLSVEKPPND
jgi:hypothetical protein